MTSFKCRNDVFTLPVHLGYLWCDENSEEVSIPNNGILNKFKTCTKTEDW